VGKGKQSILLIIAGLVLLALLVTWLSPAEETLGSSVKLVYLHGALTWVAIITYTLAGLFGLIYFLTGRKVPLGVKPRWGHAPLRGEVLLRCGVKDWQWERENKVFCSSLLDWFFWLYWLLGYHQQKRH